MTTPVPWSITSVGRCWLQVNFDAGQQSSELRDDPRREEHPATPERAAGSEKQQAARIAEAISTRDLAAGSRARKACPRDLEKPWILRYFLDLPASDRLHRAVRRSIAETVYKMSD